MHKRVEEIEAGEIPNRQGLYIFFDREQALYVGECENLSKRLKKHLGHSDNKGLARWLWQHGMKALHLEIQVLPESTIARVRKALEAELIMSRKPIFNVSGT